MVAALSSRRVLDLASEMGSYGTRLLAELGADVVKLEPPGGDRQRRRPPHREGCYGTDSSLAFAYYNASKRGITLDVGRPDAEPLLAELAAGMDAVVLSPSADLPVPGVDLAAGRLAWALDTVVVCLTPFGLDGPYRGLRATHFTSYAMGGLMARMGPAEGPPRAVPFQQMHDQLAVHAAAAVLAAWRDSPNVGPQLVDLSLHELIGSQDDQLDRYGASGEISPRGPVVSAPPNGVWECTDGMVEVLAHNPPHWRGFVDLLGSPAALADPRLADRQERWAAREQLRSAIAQLRAALPVSTVVAGAQARGVPCAAENGPQQFVDDEALAQRGYWREHDHPVLGRLRAPGEAFRASPGLLGHAGPAPTLGQHNSDVYVDELGHPAAQLRTWKEAGLV